MNLIYDATSQLICDAFRHLICKKHLYQSFALDLTFIKDAVQSTGKGTMPPLARPGFPPAPPSTTVEGVKQLLERTWIPVDALFGPNQKTSSRGPETVTFKVPSVNTYCSHCRAAWPFNPTQETVALGEGSRQCFLFCYECQQCKIEVVRFQVRREGMKIQLTGRDPIEALPAPGELPRPMSKFYCDAQIAHNAGQTLAGVFLLRTFVEQYWRSIASVQAVIERKPRATGDEMGDAYQGDLPADFKSRFPSLKDIYSKLSEAMHRAEGDGTLFEDCGEKIVEHFTARRLFKL